MDRPILTRSFKVKIGSVFAGVVSAALIGMAAASAGDVLHRCEGCNDLQMEGRAKHLGAGTHHIFSIDGGRVRAFEVLYEPELVTGPGADPWHVWSVPVSQEVRDAFQGFLLVQGPTTQVVEVRLVDLDMPNTGGASAYSIMTDFSLRGRIGDRLGQGNWPGLSPIMSALISAGLSFLGMEEPTQVHFKIMTEDGSYVVYKWQSGKPGAEYQPGMSRNADGTPIPEANSPEYQGNYSGADLERLADHMERIGATVERQGNLPGRTAQWMDCTWNSRTNTLHCTVRYTDL
jgi:hypothetical protein